MKDTNNIFYAIVKAMWKRGEDGENLAHELALALEWLCTKTH